jgi:hypothetical protein
MVAIDAEMADRTGHERQLAGSRLFGHLYIMAEINYAALLRWTPPFPPRDWSGPSLVVRTLKREVRAFGGCLGMQRR